MKVVNPLNKAPLSSETMVHSGCHCACVADTESTQSGTWLPMLPNCACGCDASYSSYNATYQTAFDQSLS